MNELEKAKLRDSLIREFNGNVTTDFSQLREKYGTGREYFIRENQMKYLIGENIVSENTSGRLQLTDKGFALFSEIENDGFVAKYWENKKEKQWKYVFGIITVLTFIILIVQFLFYFIDREPSSESLQPKEQTIIQLEISPPLSNHEKKIMDTDTILSKSSVSPSK